MSFPTGVGNVFHMTTTNELTETIEIAITAELADRLRSGERFYLVSANDPELAAAEALPVEIETYDDDQDEYLGCECEIDWKCGVCRENGYRHSVLDGPAFVRAWDDEEPF